jgi:hypothetical protein
VLSQFHAHKVVGDLLGGVGHIQAGEQAGEAEVDSVVVVGDPAPSSSSSPPSNGGVPSTHPTSSLSSGAEPGSRKASWSNVPTNQEAISKSHDTPIPRWRPRSGVNGLGRRLLDDVTRQR